MEKNNIFDGACFGKPYRTRDGRKAIYWMYDPLCRKHRTIVDNEVLNLVYSNGKICSNAEFGKDIVSEWQEEINVEELVVNKMNIFDKILQLLISIKQIIVKQ